MHRVLQRMSRTIAILLIAVMALVPLSDALACAFEAPPSHAAAVDTHGVSDACDDAGAADGAHAPCAHNHCHHTPASVPGGVVGIHDPFSAAHLLSFDDSRRFSDVSDGLMRPPRA